MKRAVTERDLRDPRYMYSEPEDYEFRADGAIVRKDRWEVGIDRIRRTVDISGDWEVSDVIEKVELIARQHDILTSAIYKILRAMPDSTALNVLIDEICESDEALAIELTPKKEHL